MPAPRPEQDITAAPVWLRPFYLAAGCIMLALGIVGAFVPVMPTTIFLILAAWCFSRSSRRLETWLIEHRQFGPVLQAWRREGAIPRRGKVMAVGGMVLGFGLFWLGAHPRLELLAGVFLAAIACAIYIVSRPEPALMRKRVP